jgi:Skp family chaperone for outer membrane proteins
MLRWVRRLTLGLAVALALAGAAPVAVAQKPAAPVIIVVDLQKIQREATSTKNIREQIGAERQTYQGQIASMENDLRQKNQELQRQRAILSTEAFAQKRQELEQSAGEMQRNVQKIQRALQRAQANSLLVVQKKVLEIVSTLMAERGANLALEKNLVIFTREEQNLDVTDEVLARLNKQLPAVTVEVKVE